MKKVICLLLVLSCSIALVACSGIGTANTTIPETQTPATENTTPAPEKEGEASDKEFVNDTTETDSSRAQIFFSAVNNSNPNVIVTQTNTTNSAIGATAVGFYRTTIYGEDNYSFEYEYEKFTKIGEGSAPTYPAASGVIYYKNGVYEGHEDYSPDFDVLGAKLDLKKEYLGNYVISADGSQLTTKISAADAEKIFGIKINATSTVEITVKTDGTHLWNITIDFSYKDTKLHLETSYTYENVSEADR